MKVERLPLPALIQRSRQAACVIVCGLFLAGCGAFKFGYSFADTMLKNRAGDYLTLTSDEQSDLDTRADALIAWHRTAMLPKYAAFLASQAEIAASGGWTRLELADSFRRFRTLVDETIEGASPFIADVLVGHSSNDKLAHLETRMREKLAERRAEEERQTPEDRLEEWVARRADRISRFTGPLTDAQTGIIGRHTEGRTSSYMRWLDNREQRQDALVAFLRTRPDRQQTARFIHRILVHPHEIVDPDYRDVSELNWALRENMYFDVLKSLSETQRQELAATLRDYAADMMDLAGST